MTQQKYVKLIEGNLEFAPKNKGSILNYDTNINLMLQDGYKPFYSIERPETNRMYHIEYEELKTRVKEVLVYDETQEEADSRELRQAKESKRNENNTKADMTRYNQEFLVTIQDKECVFDTSDKTQKDLLTAFAICSTGESYDGWITNNNIKLDLTMEDLMIIYPEFKQRSNVYDKWSYFETQIENATTKEEVDNIIIDYGVNIK